MEKSYEEDDINSILQDAEAFFTGIGTELTRGEAHSIASILSDEYFQQLDRRINATETGIPSGYSKIDEMTGGFHRGDLVILAARPSVGKTALALNYAINVARHGYPVLIFSIEMTRTQIVERFVANHARVDANLLHRGKLSQHHVSELIAQTGTLFRLPLFIDDSPDINPLQIKTRIKKVMSRVELEIKDSIDKGVPAENRWKPMALVIVDHLQLLHFPP